MFVLLVVYVRKSIVSQVINKKMSAKSKCPARPVFIGCSLFGMSAN